jgi:hypothetical protein
LGWSQFTQFTIVVGETGTGGKSTKKAKKSPIKASSAAAVQQKSATRINEGKKRQKVHNDHVNTDAEPATLISGYPPSAYENTGGTCFEPTSVTPPLNAHLQSVVATLGTYLARVVLFEMGVGVGTMRSRLEGVHIQICFVCFLINSEF